MELLGRLIKGQEMLNKNQDMLRLETDSLRDDVFGRDGLATELESRISSLETKVKIIMWLLSAFATAFIYYVFQHKL